ncbi:hypothetical protein [Arhodomonas sp. AD133]|uniref:hypothetical protein n=1 Tax=Arhodomonas sp. AD133 TaxID=3415009 RepID=UPI003EC0AB36
MQSILWRFITAYRAHFDETLSYIELVQDISKLEEALARAEREGDRRVRNLARRLRETALPEHPHTASREVPPPAVRPSPATPRAARRRPEHAELENRLGAVLANGEPDLDQREAWDAFVDEHQINTTTAASLELRVRQLNGLSAPDWHEELRSSIRRRLLDGHLRERDRLRLFETYIRRGRLSMDEAESILEKEAPRPLRRRPRLRITVAAAAIALTAAGTLAARGWLDDRSAAAPADGVVEVGESISEDTTWTADNEYHLQEVIFVEGNTTLTIEPGTRVLGEFGSALVITRSARLHASGRPDAPIVLTSARPEGERHPGDWGGVVLLGNAATNVAAARIEGVNADDPRGRFGGASTVGSCGTLEYLRIEFAGYEIFANNELNGLTLGGCPAATIVRHVQVHKALDDGIEFFGGDAGLRNVVITDAGDDGLDWDMGWTGRVQHLIVAQEPGRGDNAIEADNLKSDHNAQPRSAPTLYNVSLIGSGNAEAAQRAMTLRRGTAATLRNFLVTDFPREAVDIRDPVTAGLAGTGALSLEGGLLYQVGGDGTTWGAEETLERDDDGGFREANLFAQARAHRLQLGEPPMLGDGDTPAARFTPRSRSPAATGAVTPPKGEFWDEAAEYLGAVRPGSGAAWLTGWTAFPDA